MLVDSRLNLLGYQVSYQDLVVDKTDADVVHNLEDFYCYVTKWYLNNSVTRLDNLLDVGKLF